MVLLRSHARLRVDAAQGRTRRRSSELPGETPRHLLLLAIAQDWEVPLRQRTNTWLEVFGNARLQTRTAEYVEAKGRELVELVRS